MTNNSSLPLSLKIFLVAFSLTLAIYNTMHQGPHSLLFFCNVALFLATAGICIERTLPVSMAAVGVVLIQMLWSVDLILTVANVSPLRMTAFMLSDNLSPFKKSLALFHAWLPFVLLFAVSRLGYDERALPWWTPLTCVIAAGQLSVSAAPARAADNPTLSVNSTSCSACACPVLSSACRKLAWLLGMMIVLPLLAFLPTPGA